MTQNFSRFELCFRARRATYIPANKVGIEDKILRDRLRVHQELEEFHAGKIREIRSKIVML